MAPRDALPVSQATTAGVQTTTDGPEQLNGLRRRIASFSVKIQPISTATTEWAIRRTQSMPSFKEIASPWSRWWSWGTAWLLCKKANLSRDLEMSGEGETATMLGRRGTASNAVKHLFYKIRSEFRKLVGSEKLPTTHKFGYDSFSYAQNFDDGGKAQL